MSLVDLEEELLLQFDTEVNSNNDGQYPATEEIDTGESEIPPTGRCNSCKKESHLRRRWIICVDGTWMDADGAHGSFKGNATNVFRIWAMAKEGIIKDETGMWEQKRKRFIPGIGAVDNYFQRIFSGITGKGSTGYETKIKDIYKFCCHEVCSKEDEIFMFGFSRGAFVGLLYHLRALSPDLPNFDQEFFRLLQVYRGAQDNAKEWENRVYEVRSYTKRAPCIKFVGLFDTVKAVNDSNLNDIASFKKVHHVRHALALFEKRKVFRVEHFNFDLTITKNHTIQEAWFAGSHSNIGGSCEQDGLALWPLHWIVTEAMRYGFTIGFKHDHLSKVTDPSKLIFPEDDTIQRSINTKNGIQVDMHNLSSTLETYGFFPKVDGGNSMLPFGEEHRAIFFKNTLIGFNEEAPTGLFIHPSVFFLDQTSSPIISFTNKLPYSRSLRQQEPFTIPDQSQVFWTLGTKLATRRYAEKPRILVCGQTGAGKSHLINQVLGKEVTPVSKKLNTGEHDVTVPLEVEGANLIVHDSKGFDSGKDENYEEVQEFVIKRRAEHRFQELIHCIWYVVSLESHRAQATDIKFSELDFGQVPVLLVFTNLDGLRMRQRDNVVRDYKEKHKNLTKIEDLGDIPAADRPLARNQMEELIRQEEMRKKREWNEMLLGKFSKTLFTSIREEDQHLIKILIDESHTAMTSDRIASMHQNAQLNFVKNQIELSISTLQRIFLRDDGFKSALDAVATIFNLKGLHPVTFTSTIHGHLWQAAKTPSPRSSWFSIIMYTTVFRGVLFFLILGALASALGITPEAPHFYHVLLFALSRLALVLVEQVLHAPHLIFTAVFQGSISLLVWKFVGLIRKIVVPEPDSLTDILLMTLWWTGIVLAEYIFKTSYVSVRLSTIQIQVCIDILLVIERIYWYGGRDINELSVRCACLYYLKLRPQVHARLAKKISWFSILPGQQQTARILTELFEEFKYKRQELDEL